MLQRKSKLKFNGRYHQILYSLRDDRPFRVYHMYRSTRTRLIDLGYITDEIHPLDTRLTEKGKLVLKALNEAPISALTKHHWFNIIKYIAYTFENIIFDDVLACWLIQNDFLMHDDDKLVSTSKGKQFVLDNYKLFNMQKYSWQTMKGIFQIIPDEELMLLCAYKGQYWSEQWLQTVAIKAFEEKYQMPYNDEHTFE